MTEVRHLWRIGSTIALLVIAFSGLAMRLGMLQLGENEALKQRVERTRLVRVPMRVGRGRILDRRGRILAMDRILHDVCADPAALLEAGLHETVGRKLAEWLDADPDAVVQQLSRPQRRYARVARSVPDEVLRRIQAEKVPHVWFEPVSVRAYPGGSLACHVVGFSNVEGVGSAGIEQRLDRYLRGREGIRISEQDGRGREIYSRRLLEIAAQEGADIHLTLDLDVQDIVETVLDQRLPQTGALAGWVVVQRVRTGEILAMASRPHFDLNAYNKAPEEARRNRVIAYVYEPGSTFKVAVIAAALDLGIVKPEDLVDCENGLWRFRGKPLRDYHPHGVLNVADVLKKSSNIGAAKIAVQLGEDRLDLALRRFGFGKPCGIELPGEEGGIFHPRSAWTSISISRIAMGHEIAVTSLQMLNAMCAIANEGFLLRPRVVARITDTQGRTLFESTPEVLERPLSASGARLMCRLLERVTEPGGTGVKAVVPGYRVAGKTGTAQKPIPGGYASDRNIASFVGFLPAHQPEIAMIVVLDDPQPVRTGGGAAAPIFADIAAQAVRVLGITPDGAPQVIDPMAEFLTEPVETAGNDPRTAL